MGAKLGLFFWRERKGWKCFWGHLDLEEDETAEHNNLYIYIDYFRAGRRASTVV